MPVGVPTLFVMALLPKTASFAWSNKIGWWIFAVTGVAVVLPALATISLQALKAANNNPFKSLRIE